MTYLGYALFIICLLLLLGLIGGLPAHRDGWRAGLRQYGRVLLLLVLALGIMISSLWPS